MVDKDGFLGSALAAYSDAKVAIDDATGAGQDLLHVHVGLVIFVLVALLLRKKMRSPIPLAVVVFFGLLNELVDWLGGKPIDTLEPYVDFANTVFWPLVLFVLARRWR